MEILNPTRKSAPNTEFPGPARFFDIRVFFLVCLVGFLGCCSPSQKLPTTSETKLNTATDSSHATILNQDSVFRLIFQSKEINILRDAGVPCSIPIRIYINDQGEYNGHTFLGKCHPLAEEAINPRIKYLRFIPAWKNGIPISSEEVITIKWATY